MPKYFSLTTDDSVALRKICEEQGLNADEAVLATLGRYADSQTATLAITRLRTALGTLNPQSGVKATITHHSSDTLKTVVFIESGRHNCTLYMARHEVRSRLKANGPLDKAWYAAKAQASA